MKPCFLLLGLAGLIAGCETAEHHGTSAHRPPPGMSPAVIYYHEASQRLAESRRDGFLNNEEYADLLEKLQGDLRQILVAEAESHHPANPGPMMLPPGHPMPMHPPRREREDN